MRKVDEMRPHSPFQPEGWPNLLWNGGPTLGTKETRDGIPGAYNQVFDVCGLRWEGWLPSDDQLRHDAMAKIIEAHVAATGCDLHRDDPKNCETCRRRQAA